MTLALAAAGGAAVGAAPGAASGAAFGAAGLRSVDRIGSGTIAAASGVGSGVGIAEVDELCGAGSAEFSWPRR
jgi:hypothetical protein